MQTRNSIKKALTLGFLFFGAVHCATSGKDFPARTEWIKKEATRQQDVISVMGEPYSVGNSGGTPTWTYGYYRYELFGKGGHKELKIYWGGNQTVDHYSFDSSFPADIQAAYHK